MKYKSHLLFFLLFLSANILFGQTVHDNLPLLWYRADSALTGEGHFRNTISDTHHAIFTDGNTIRPDTLLNFNPAFHLNGSGSFAISRLPLSSVRVTTIIVYQTPEPVDEMGLWEVKNPLDNTSTGLSTQRILSSRGSIRYGRENETRTIINTLGQSWRGQNDSVPSAQFNIALYDTLPFKGLLAECLLFDRELSSDEVVSWISYLAVKHGVTLYETNYEDSEGRIVWNYDDYTDYSYSIAGIGRDDARGLLQKQSGMSQIGFTAGLGEFHIDNASNDNPITDREFLLWGFDSTGLGYQESIYESGEEYPLYGNGLLQRTGIDIVHSPTFLHIDGGDWENPSGLFLLIDRSGTGAFDVSGCEWVSPSFVDSSGAVYYHNVYWDTDTNGIDRFCFAYATNVARSALSGGNEKGNDTDGTADNARDAWSAAHTAADGSSFLSTEAANRYRLYPNPTAGEFQLEVDYAEASDVRVLIYNAAGQLVREASSGFGSSHRFKERLPVSGHYLIEVRGGDENKSFKLVVQ